MQLVEVREAGIVVALAVEEAIVLARACAGAGREELAARGPTAGHLLYEALAAALEGWATTAALLGEVPGADPEAILAARDPLA